MVSARFVIPFPFSFRAASEYGLASERNAKNSGLPGLRQAYLSLSTSSRASVPDDSSHARRQPMLEAVGIRAAGAMFGAI
jgi:hypothetical protein